MSLKFRTITLIFFNLALFSGCFWQILNICKLYFNYPTNLFIDMKFNVLTKEMPALTFCTNVGGGNAGKNTSEALELNSLKFKLQMFSNIWHKINGNWIDMKNELLKFAVERISLSFYCITLNSFLTGRTINEMRFTDRITFRLDKFGIYDTWWLFIHNSTDMPSSSEWNTIDGKKGFVKAVTWKLSSFKLLESPFSTDCKKYRSSTPYLSRKDCIRKCKLNISVSECGVVYDEVDHERKDNSTFFGTDNLKDRLCVGAIDFDGICMKECPHYDCRIDYYKPILVSEADYTKCDISYADLDLVLPTEPEMSYICEARIETVEFICYLASTVGMWFGVSMFSFYDLLLLFRRQVVNIKNNRVKVKVQNNIRLSTPSLILEYLN